MEQRIGPFVVTDQKLGEGGQVSGDGEGVFLGTDTRNSEQVAVKKFAFRRSIAVDDATERTSKYTRLKREVQNQWKLSRGHPNIVTCVSQSTTSQDGTARFRPTRTTSASAR